jgi:hypothetical protein
MVHKIFGEMVRLMMKKSVMTLQLNALPGKKL